MKKLIITEDQYKNLIDEDYPTSWDKEHFKSLKSFRARIRYCEKNLQRISSGSSRIAYKIDDQKVLKLAKNKKGLAQNDVEISYSRDIYLEDILAKVFDYDNNDLWLEMELAEKLTYPRFKKITGYNFKDFVKVLTKSFYDNNRSRYRGMLDPTTSMDEELIEEIWEDDFYMAINDYMVNYNIPTGDLTRTSSYGIVKRDYGEDIVLIDYGLDNNVAQTYYS